MAKKIKQPFIKVENECKVYQDGGAKVVANKDISFTINEGELVVILGPSGAGKSTLLNILGGMDKPTSGAVIVDSKHIEKLNERQLTSYRRHDVGFVFQFYNLVQNLTAKENVELATDVTPNALDPQAVLAQVGLAKRLNNFPAQLSGGEQQRVAIARALAKNPKLLLCDEPTGALDYKTGKQILQTLQDTSRKHHKTVVIITHNSAIAGMADKVIHINDAQVKDIVINKNPQNVADIEW